MASGNAYTCQLVEHAVKVRCSAASLQAIAHAPPKQQYEAQMATTARARVADNRKASALGSDGKLHTAAHLQQLYAAIDKQMASLKDLCLTAHSQQTADSK